MAARAQGKPHEIADRLIALLAGERGTKCTAKALRMCLSLILKKTDGDAFSPHDVTLSLLASARGAIAAAAAAAAAPAATAAHQRVAVRRDSDAAGPSKTPLADVSAAEPSQQTSGSGALPGSMSSCRAHLRRAEAALQVLSIIAAEQPAALTGLVPRVLDTAFPRSQLAELQLVQKWALDSIYHLALDPSTIAEVCNCSLLLPTPY